MTNEIRPDRQVTDLILVGLEAAGSIEAEYSFEAIDTLLEGAMFNSWVEKANSNGADMTDVTATTIDMTTGAAFLPGQLIRTTGFAI